MTNSGLDLRVSAGMCPACGGRASPGPSPPQTPGAVPRSGTALIQNLRRFLGYDLQYFAAIEPQRRLAPHVHIAMRGTISRADLRQVITATYHQVWWPPVDVVRFDGEQFPVWHEASGNYLDPVTGEVLPAWDDALEAMGPQDCTWPGSGPSSTPRACWPGQETPAGASGT